MTTFVRRPHAGEYFNVIALLLPTGPIVWVDAFVANRIVRAEVHRAHELGPEATIDLAARSGSRDRGGGALNGQACAGLAAQTGGPREYIGADGEPGELIGAIESSGTLVAAVGSGLVAGRLVTALSSGLGR